MSSSRPPDSHDHLWLLPVVEVRDHGKRIEFSDDETGIVFEGLGRAGMDFARMLEGNTRRDRILCDPLAPLLLPALGHAGWLVTSSKPPGRFSLQSGHARRSSGAQQPSRPRR